MSRTGVQSTQRAESIHSAIKKKTSASGLLTQLGETLLKYASGSEIRGETRKARDILVHAARSFGNHAGHMVAIQSLEGKISTHAMELLKAQQAQAMAYTITEGLDLNGTQTYVVQRPCKGTSIDQQRTSVDDDMHIYEDYGLSFATNNSRIQMRHASIYACTCQFQSCWGIPCRHMLRIYLQLQLPTIPDGVVKQCWWTHDAEYIQQQKRKLLRTIPMQVNIDNTRRDMTRAERYNYLLSESKSLAEVASISEQAMEIFVKHIDMAKEDINKLDLPQNLEGEAHSFDPSLFPSNILNPGLPLSLGRPETKRKENHGKIGFGKSTKRHK